MLTIKLQRVGKKNQPQFRFVLVEKARDPFGRAKEILGWYHPRSSQMEIKKDRVEYWIGNGAQATNTVWNILVDQGIVKGEKRKSIRLSDKRRAKIEEADKAKKEAEAAKKAEEEAKKAAEAEAKKAAEEAAAAEAKAEAEAPVETPAPAEEKPAEAPAEPAPTEETKSE